MKYLIFGQFWSHFAHFRAKQNFPQNFLLTSLFFSSGKYQCAKFQKKTDGQVRSNVGFGRTGKHEFIAPFCLNPEFQKQLLTETIMQYDTSFGVSFSSFSTSISSLQSFKGSENISIVALSDSLLHKSSKRLWSGETRISSANVWYSSLL